MAVNNQNSNKTENNKYDEHTQKYTELLSAFITNAKGSNSVKNGLKISFFVFIVVIMIALIVLFFCSIFKAFGIIMHLNLNDVHNLESVIGSVVSIIPSLATILVSLIKLPEIIAKYLFNPQEDNNMLTIIEKIQKYDIEMYTLDKDIERIMMERKLETGNTDDQIDKLEADVTEPDDVTANAVT